MAGNISFVIGVVSFGIMASIPETLPPEKRKFFRSASDSVAPIYLKSLATPG